MDEINLYSLMRFYAKNWLILISALIIGAVIGLIYTGFIQTPMYKSQASVVVTGIERSGSQDSVMIKNYINLFKSNRVLGPVAEEHDYNGGVERLRSNITATNEEGSDFISLTASSYDPKKSKEILDSSIDNFKDQASDLYEDANIVINTVDEASIAHAPYNVNSTSQIVISMASTFILVVIMLFFMYDYRTSQKASDNSKTKNSNQDEEPENKEDSEETTKETEEIQS